MLDVTVSFPDDVGDFASRQAESMQLSVRDYVYGLVVRDQQKKQFELGEYISLIAAELDDGRHSNKTIPQIIDARKEQFASA